MNKSYTILTATLVLGCAIPGMSDGLNIPAEIKEAFNEASLGESGGMWFTDSPTSAKAREMAENMRKWFAQKWPEIIQNYDSILTTQKDRMTCLEIAETLPPAVYLDYLNQMLDKVTSRTVPEEIAERAFVGRNLKDGFLAYNYTDPTVQALLAKAHKTFKPNGAIQSFIEDARTGELRDRLVFDRNGKRQPMPEPLPPISQQKLAASDTLPDVQLISKHAPPELALSTPSGEPTSSTPRSVVAVLIVAAIGLLWLLLKNRK